MFRRLWDWIDRRIDREVNIAVKRRGYVAETLDEWGRLDYVWVDYPPAVRDGRSSWQATP